MFSDKAKKSESKDREITYIPVKQGFLYLVAIMDWATRKVLSWRLSNTPDGAVRRMRTRIRLLVQPESMHSIIGATQ